MRKPAFMEGTQAVPVTALKIVADVAQRFGQDFDAKTELGKAQEEAKKRRAQRAAEDVFTNLPADLVSAKAKAQAQTNGAQV